jgi:hypothetical protein
MPEQVVRLSVLIDVAERAASSLNEALESATPFLAAEDKVGLVTNAEAMYSRLSARPLLHVPMPRLETAEWDRLVVRLSPRQKAALVALLPTSPG